MTDVMNVMIYDFSNPANVADWRSIDDRIMGGCSKSRTEHVAGVGLRFHGTVSLENNGGFASIRSAAQEHDLSACTGIRLKVRGDGKRYKLSLRTDRYFDGISYQAGFGTTADTWTVITLPFTDFIPTHHGNALTTVEPLQFDQIQSFGLFISECQPGSFCLDVVWIKGV